MADQLGQCQYSKMVNFFSLVMLIAIGLIGFVLAVLGKVKLIEFSYFDEDKKLIIYKMIKSIENINR